MSNYASPEKVAQAQELRRLGYSLRYIMRVTGLHRETLCKYVGKISRSDAMKAHHARRRGENVQMQVVEGIERKARFVPIGKIEPVKKPALEPIEPTPVTTRAGVAGNYRFDIREKLSAEEEAQLWHAWKVGGDITARDLILRCHLHHVVQIAYLFPKCGHPIEALIAEGNFGMMQAVEKFEPERGLRFVTYAAWWIKAAISKYIQKSRTILGKELVRSKNLYKLRRELVRARNVVGEDRGAIEQLLAQRLEMPLGQVQDLLRRLECYDVSLDAKSFEAATLLDSLAADTIEPEHRIELKERAASCKGVVDKALDRLDPREKIIVEQRLMSDEPLSLAELGKKLGFSRERARQLEERAIKKLRNALKEAKHAE
jgi:RNA polymerase sigma-32 factor